MKYSGLRIMLAACVLVGSAFLQAEAATQAGAKELQIFGSIMNSGTGDNDTQTVLMGGTANYYTSDTASFGITGLIMVNSSDEMDNGTTTLQLRGDLYLVPDPTAEAVPYIGADFGVTATTTTSDSYYGSSESSSSSASYGLHGGVKVFTTETSSFNLEGRFMTYEQEGAEEKTTQTSLNVGLSVYFY